MKIRYSGVFKYGMNKRKDVLDKLNIINGYRVKTLAPKRRTAKGLYLNI